MNSQLLTLTFLAILLSHYFALGQNDKKLTKTDYDRASAMLDINTQKFIDYDISPSWTTDNRIWYKSVTNDKAEFKLFNPINKKFIIENSLKKLAETGKIEFPRESNSEFEILSPNNKYVAFIRNWNLWIRELSSGKERALTQDGIEDFGYATDNAGWRHSNKPIISWSSDSKRIATFKQDQRHVKDMYLVKTKIGAPELMKWKYPLPGDKEIIKIHRVIIDISENSKIVKLKMNPDPRRGSLCDDISCEGGFDDVQWSEDNKNLVFVSTSRDHKQAKVRIANCVTGEVKDIFEENVKTQYESGRGAINWRYHSKSNEIIWYSERSDWGHLYLYNARTGTLKNQITKGKFVVKKVLKVDEKSRMIYFVGGPLEGDGNPYFNFFYKVNFNGKNLKKITPAIGDHLIELSPNGKYFVDSYSQPDVAPIHEVRDLNGNLISVLEKTNVERLEATGWKPPKTVKVKSANGQWDLYGLVYTPTAIRKELKYPVIIRIYPGPQGGSVGSWRFIASRRDNLALAELGFVVVEIEGSCNPNRSKSFHDACYGNMGENTLPDQIAGLKELKKEFPYMDLERVGIWGHSGGGYATATAMFKYPDFFKVGIAESGNHDNRNYEDDWGERYIGLVGKNPDGVSNYEQQANQNFAKKLKGKLFIIHGGMDDNVPPYNTYLVVDALIKSNKDFDFLLLPNARHSYGEDNYYIMRRRWDYFVKHLMGVEPPKEYKIDHKQVSRLK